MVEVVSRGEWDMLQGSQHSEVEVIREVSQVRLHSSNLGIELWWTTCQLHPGTGRRYA